MYYRDKGGVSSSNQAVPGCIPLFDSLERLDRTCDDTKHRLRRMHAAPVARVSADDQEHDRGLGLDHHAHDRLVKVQHIGTVCWRISKAATMMDALPIVFPDPEQGELRAYEVSSTYTTKIRLYNIHEPAVFVNQVSTDFDLRETTGLRSVYLELPHACGSEELRPRRDRWPST